MADPLQLVGRVAEFAVPPRGSARLLQTTRGRVSGPSEVKVVRKMPREAPTGGCNAVRTRF